MRRHSFLLASCSLLLTLSYAQAVHPADRIHSVPDNSRTVTLKGNRHPSANARNEVGIASPSHRMDKMILVLAASAEQNQALDALIAEQQDPSSNSYRKWLTPEQFAQQFGASRNDVDQVSAWLQSQGFTIDEVPTGGRAIVFSGTAGMVQTAFHTVMKQYRVHGELHTANAADPEIPEALAAVVQGTVTLHDFPRHAMTAGKQSVPEFSSGGSNYLAPADFATIYNLNPLYAATIDGTGTSIAIVGRTNINISDVQTFRSYFGLPVNNPQIIVNGTNPGITSDIDEAILDVEWSGAVARGAAVKFVVSASTNSSDGVDLSAQYIVSHNVAPVMSTSYGSCEAAMGSGEMTFYSNLWQQAASQGISTFISAGDSGAAGCDEGSETTASYGRAINGLCSSVYSVCVGGTQFADTTNYSAYWSGGMNATTKQSAISYIPEIAWNQSGSVSGGSGLWAGGGGASAVYAKPSWQTGPGVPSDGRRDVPDVSLAASTHDGYLVVLGGYLYVIGGTSASSPSLAGIMALVNQKNASAQGNPNPVLYQLAVLQANHTTAHSYFHDITSGSNTVPGVTGYTAAAGYDLATGLGTINASDFVNFWHDAVITTAPSLKAAMSATALTVRQGGSGTSTVTITVAGGFSSAVALAVSGLPSGVTATLASKTLSAPGSGTSVLTIAAGAAAGPGISTITVTASGGSTTSTATVVLTVTRAFSIAANVSTITVQPGTSAPLTLTSVIASGFSGAVVLTASYNGAALPAGITVGFAPSTLSAPGSGTSAVTIAVANAVAPGAYSIVISGTSGSMVGTANIVVTVPAPAFSLSVAASTITAPAGSAASTTISMTSTSASVTSAMLAASGMPAGVTIQFSPASVTTRGAATMTAKVATTVAAGRYLLTITGTAPGVPSETVLITLAVSGFTVTAPATASVTRGANVAVPVTTTVSGGFTGALALTATGLPAGVTALYTPAAITNPAAGSSSLRLTAAPSATPGTKTITLVATSPAGAVQTATVTLTVH
jgi:subtilase family serine protease